MRKYLFLILAAILFGLTSCGEDSCDHTIGSGTSAVTYENLAGSWYDPNYNEEVTYTTSGTLHDKYANAYAARTTEGRYEISGNKLTYRYKFMGQTQFADFTMSNFKENVSITLKSKTIGNTVLYRITNTVNLDLNKIDRLTESGLESPDTRIVSVNGTTIKSEGMKGTVYLKNANGTYTKVVVGTECSDLWMDYTIFIDKSVAELKSALGTPSSSNDVEASATSEQEIWYTDVANTHDILKTVGFTTKDGIVTGLGLYFKDGVSTTDLNNYMAAKFFYNSTIKMYTSHEDLVSSTFVASYVSDSNGMVFIKKPTLLTDYTSLFGKTKSNIKTYMTNAGCSFAMSDYSYSANGSDYYTISDNDYTDMIGFVFNTDEQMSEYWLYLTSTSVVANVYSDLTHSYYEATSEKTTSQRVFYNKDKSLKVVLDLKNTAVVYTNLTMTQHVAPKTTAFGNYYEAIGLTTAQIKSKFGDPYTTTETSLVYLASSDNVKFVFMTMDTATGKCKNVSLYLKDNVEQSTVLDYYNGIYTVYAKGTASDGSQYAWVDGATVAESTMGIVYYPSDKMVVYVPLGTSSSATKAKAMAEVAKVKASAAKSLKK